MKGGRSNGRSCLVRYRFLGLQASRASSLRCKTPPGKRTSKKRHKRWWIRKKIPLDFVRTGDEQRDCQGAPSGKMANGRAPNPSWRPGSSSRSKGRSGMSPAARQKKGQSRERRESSSAPSLRVQYARLSNRGTAIEKYFGCREENDKKPHGVSYWRVFGLRRQPAIGRVFRPFFQKTDQIPCTSPPFRGRLSFLSPRYRITEP